jgi:hypothetical protein
VIDVSYVQSRNVSDHAESAPELAVQLNTAAFHPETAAGGQVPSRRLESDGHVR